MNVSRLALSGLLSLTLLPGCATSVVLKGIQNMDPFFRLRTGSSDDIRGVDGFVRDARGNLGMRARTASGMSPIREVLIPLGRHGDETHCANGSPG